MSELDEYGEPKNAIVRTSRPNFDSSKNRPGYDMVIAQEGQDVIAVRCIEFDEDNVNYLCSLVSGNTKDGTGRAKYLLYADGSNSKAYLMEYPVSYVSGFVETESVNKDQKTNVAQAILETSGLKINLATKQIIKTGTVWGGSEDEEVVIDDLTIDNSYLQLTKASETNTDEPQSSFIVSGYTKMPVGIDLTTSTLDSSTEVYTGRVILRDYLELTYAPDFAEEAGNSDENLVAFGRRIRLNTKDHLIEDSDDNIVTQYYFEDNTSAVSKQGSPLSRNFSQTYLEYQIDGHEPIGRYILKNGTVLSPNDTTKQVYLDDICDALELATGKTTTSGNMDLEVKILRYDKNIKAGKVQTGNVERAENDTTSVATGETRSKLNEIDTLVHEVAEPDDTINTTVGFPSEYIATADYKSASNSNMMFMYGIATSNNIYGKSLYSSWLNINNTGKEESKNTDATEENSVQYGVTWWNDMLKRSGMAYQIAEEQLNSYLYGKYSDYSDAATGTITIDLETVQKVQKEMDAEADLNVTHII